MNYTIISDVFHAGTLQMPCLLFLYTLGTSIAPTYLMGSVQGSLQMTAEGEALVHPLCTAPLPATRLPKSSYTPLHDTHTLSHHTCCTSACYTTLHCPTHAPYSPKTHLHSFISNFTYIRFFVYSRSIVLGCTLLLLPNKIRGYMYSLSFSL